MLEKINERLKQISFENKGLFGFKHYNNYLEFYNYKSLLEISNRKVIVDNVEVSGNQIVLFYLDDSIIILKGNIENINFK